MIGGLQEKATRSLAKKSEYHKRIRGKGESEVGTQEKK